MYALLAEGKKDKARNIINLALDKMPIDYYMYYSTIDPFADGWYKLGEKEKAQKLLSQLMSKYKEHLTFYKSFKPSEQYYLRSEIMTDLYRYENLLKIMKDNGDIDFYNKSKATFDSFDRLFQ